MGITNKKKNMDRIANPLAVRAYVNCQGRSIYTQNAPLGTHNDTVVPGEDRKFIQSSDQIPPGCDVASYKDPKCEDRERVHRAVATIGALLFVKLDRIRETVTRLARFVDRKGRFY